jgi:hypothetical protein
MSKHPNRRILFTVQESPQLPRELWERFKAETQRRRETWIAVLRKAIERYLAEGRHETPNE